MTEDGPDYMLFVGATDTESATTRLRASGVVYRKKMLSSGPQNWVDIVAMITSANNRGTLVALTSADYRRMCHPDYEEPARDLLDALVGRPHIVFVHEAVFLTDEQRAAADSEHVDQASLANINRGSLDDDELGMFLEDRFPVTPDDVRQQVNTMLRKRALDVVPYRTNVERSIVASGFLDDHERHLLFRLYVPSNRLYAQEAETLLGLFREWLSQTGHDGVRQEGYSTAAGQVFEFFSARAEPAGALPQYFKDFSAFLDRCMASPTVAASELSAAGMDEFAASTIVARFAVRGRRLSLDLKQRREERILGLKHELENVTLEIEGLEGDRLSAVLEELLPAPRPAEVLRGSSEATRSLTVNNFNPLLINQVAGSVVQNVDGTVNLGTEARQLLDLVTTYGGRARGQLETAVHELEDDGARAPDRIAARGRLKRFLADLGNRGLGIGLDLLQKYVEHKIGVS